MDTDRAGDGLSPREWSVRAQARSCWYLGNTKPPTRALNVFVDVPGVFAARGESFVDSSNCSRHGLSFVIRSAKGAAAGSYPAA